MGNLDGSRPFTATQADPIAAENWVLRLLNYSRMLLIVPLISLFLVIYLTYQVLHEVKQLRHAEYDSVQWTLSQVEVEFLSFMTTLDRSVADPNRLTDHLRISFDIFFSRIDNFENGRSYRELKQDPEFAHNLSILSDFLMRMVPIIDSSDEVLQAYLPFIQEQSTLVAGDVRDLASIGIHHFTENAAQQRDNIGATLKTLTVTTAFLLLTLGLLAYYFDSLRRQSETQRQRLVEASVRTNAVISTALDAVIVSNEDGKVLEFNTAAVEIFGYSRAEAMGRQVDELIVPPKYKNVHARALKRAAKSGVFNVVSQGRVRFEASRANGEHFPIELALQKTSIQGRHYYVAYIRDISFRLRAEQDLIEARDQALAGEKAKSRFLAIMSHEIRTPMNGLLGNLSLLRDTNLQPQQLEYIRNMETSGKLLTDHVNDVLDIARYDYGKPVIRTRPTDLRQVIKTAVDSQDTYAKLRGNLIRTVWTGPERSWVNTDPGRLQQILINLLSNAIKFTSEGEITVEVRCRRRDEQVEIRVSDTGIGIAPDYQKKVFDDFVTHDDSYGRMAEGTGLGLGIVRRITETLGGTLGLESTLGKGSSFWVKLNLSTADPEREAPRVEVTTAEAEGQAVQVMDVLVVEDNAINRDVVRAMLTREGHKVFEAHDGRAGVELAALQRFDLILMDISMPVLDGREATKIIRAGKGASAQTPIVALTAHLLPENVTEFMDDGMQDVLPKPLMRRDLQRILKAHARQAPTNLDGTDDCGTASQSGPQKALIEKTVNLALRESVGMAYETLLTTMQHELTQLVSWLEQETQNLPEIAERCHRFASSAAVFGAEPLRQHLIDMELAGKSGNYSLMALRREMLPCLLRDTLVELRSSDSAAA